MTHQIIKLFLENQDKYRTKEIGDETHDLTKKVLEQIFGLSPKSSLISETNLFGDVMYDNFYSYEGSKKQWDKARRDFKCKINWQIVVVETERLDNIQAGMKQIWWYMKAENTNYGIVTDGYLWRFFKRGADDLDIYETLTIEELCDEKWSVFIQNYYNTYDFYVSRLSSVVAQPFDTQIFHTWLITTAERIVFDLRYIGLFTGDSKEVAKEEIQTAYSLIIQILLIKIVQDKRKINLLKIETIIEKLQSQDRNGIFEAVEWQIKWLWDFYKPYHNQQDSLLSDIITHYQSWSRIAKLNLDSVRLFLDLYHFIYSFDLKDVRQDLFGAVYENYLKELYKDDDTKKWQVFTPPEIVEFMLDEVGYTVEHIQWVITDHLPSLIANLHDHSYNIPWLSLIDPACGSGTFLYKAAGRIVNALYHLHKSKQLNDDQAGKIAELLICNNIVGFDIESFPLYLAEMNILQSLLFFNVSASGQILNSIDHPIKIFSTDDSIAEFHNLESSMEKDLQDLITWRDLAMLSSKRDPKSILQLKADLQDFDRDALMTKFQLELYHEALQNEFLIVDSGELVPTTTKSYRSKHSKKIKNLTTVAELLDYVHQTLDAKYLVLFQKKIITLKPQLDNIRAKLSEIVTKQATKRTKFDFVVANPPYVNMKNTKDRWTTIYWYDINNPQRKTVKTTGDYLNIYAYFYYLGIFLLKNDGKLCFITPRDIIYKTAMNKTKRFLKEISSIKKIIDFNNAALFYNRWVAWNNIVGTTSVILLLEKNQQKWDVNCIKYHWEENLLDFVWVYQKETKKRTQDMNLNIISYNDLFDDSIEANQFSLISHLHSTFWEDLCITTYPKLWKNSDPKAIENFNKVDVSILSQYPLDRKNRFLNKKQSWYFYFSNSNDYIFPWTNPKLYYDINKLWTWIPYRTWIEVQNSIDWNNVDWNKQIRILNKQIRINWEYHYHTNKKFSFSDDCKIISDQWNKMTIWISNIWKIDEIYFLFGILNSSYIGNVIVQKCWSICNQKNIEQLPIPILNTPAKLQLKTDLIANSEAIITLCKRWSSWWPTTWGDICEMTFDPDSLWEKIIGLRSEYTHLSITLDPSSSPTDPLPEDVLLCIQSETSDLATLEAQRDEIVRQLYELD